jgi:hypothetical protein
LELEAAGRVVPRAQRAQVRGRDQGEGVRVLLQFSQTMLVVKQLGRRETEDVHTPQHVDAVIRWPPARAVVGQHREAGHARAPAVDQAVVVGGKHSVITPLVSA